MKILILMTYFNRPILVKNGLKSILAANEYYQDWELAFGDDGSVHPGRSSVEEILSDHMDKVTIVESGMGIEEKLQKGLILGKMANEQIKKSNADVAIIMGDDDELVPTYLRDLSLFFKNNPETLYCYSKVYLYNPLVQKSSDAKKICTGKYNQEEGRINPVNKVDATQVAWRLSCCKEYGAWFKDTTLSVKEKPWVQDTDKSFFEQLHDKCGLCHPTGLVAQYKGIHDYQLLWHKNVKSSILRDYEKMCREFGGVKF